MTLRTLASALAAGALLLPCPAVAKKKVDESAAWTLPDESPAPSAKELAKRFPGASAVVVLDAVEHRWTEDMEQVTTRQLRLRLIEAAAEADAQGLRLFLPEGSGPWTALDGTGRLVGADGTEKVEFQTNVEQVDGGLVASVSFPTAEAGDLLEVVQRASTKRPSFPPWRAQDAEPVLESRVLVVPPPVITLRAYGSGLPEGSLEPEKVMVGESEGAGWRFRDLPPLPSGPLAAPPELAAARLLLAVEKFPDLASGGVGELDWPTWGRLTAQAAGAWADGPTIQSLRARLGEKPEPARVLSSLRERFAVERTAAWPEHDTAAAALEAGRGSSAELALLAASALGWPEAEGVELVAARAFGRGPVASVAPIDGNFTELVVRAGETWLDTAPGGEAGDCPARLRGTSGAEIRAGVEGPKPLPERRAEDNRVERTAQLALSGEGALSGTASLQLSALARELDTAGGADESTVAREGWGRREGSSLTYGVLPWRLFQDLDLGGEPPEGLIDLGWPRLVIDRVSVDLPPGVTGAKLCAPATIDAGPAGRYERTVKPDGRTVTVTRTFRLDVTRFGPEESAALFEWLRRVQEAERAETDLTLQ